MKVIISQMMFGDDKVIDLPTKASVNEFIERYAEVLPKSKRVRITVDALGMSGYLQGKA